MTATGALAYLRTALEISHEDDAVVLIDGARQLLEGLRRAAMEEDPSADLRAAAVQSTRHLELIVSRLAEIAASADEALIALLSRGDHDLALWVMRTRVDESLRAAERLREALMRDGRRPPYEPDVIEPVDEARREG